MNRLVSKMYKLYSTLFLESDVEQYNCYVNEMLWKRITNDLMANRIFIRLNNGTDYWICSLGQPIYTSFDYPETDLSSETSINNIYLPKWMLEQINCEGMGETINIDWFPSDVFEQSTKITLQPHKSIAHIENIQDILSHELTKLAVLKKNSTIVINMPEEMKFEVVSLEPASIVLCEGDEVHLEFMESLDSIARPPTPYPFDSVPTLLQPSAPVIEEPITPVPILGGVKREAQFNPWRNKDFKPTNT